MTKSEKIEFVQNLTSEFESANGIVVCDYKGLSVPQIEQLRNSARESNLKVKVVRNTLANIALKNAGIQDLNLENTNLLVWGEDIVALAKTTTAYAKEATNKFVIKGGYFENEVVDVSKVEAYSKLASKEEFIGMLLSVWTAPARNMAYVLNAVPSGFVTVLENIKEKKESA